MKTLNVDGKDIPINELAEDLKITKDLLKHKREEVDRLEDTLIDAVSIVREATQCCDLTQKFCGKAEKAKEFLKNHFNTPNRR